MKALTIFLCVFCLYAQANETQIDGPMFDDGKYSVVVDRADGPSRTVIIKRTGPYFTSYIKEQYDCARLQYRYMGTGSTSVNIVEEPADAPWFAIRQGDWRERVRDKVCLESAKTTASQ
ncbi:hypothetical protein [Pseudomonas sp. HMWF021]|jgi:hypothetical protein|uniref:hypothetical protein n=1 Tax=Pseudomonas sp. HMWF021 TaxID=2056857 RepID=UPI000D361877|nr:hypothetical protein [Pseudomonas sp. HMWF021]PTT31880.1 hypothetical protein DBR18_05700 [Pseudomonas sp. HMWF021]